MRTRKSIEKSYVNVMGKDYICPAGLQIEILLDIREILEETLREKLEKKLKGYVGRKIERDDK